MRASGGRRVIAMVIVGLAAGLAAGLMWAPSGAQVVDLAITVPEGPHAPGTEIEATVSNPSGEFVIIEQCRADLLVCEQRGYVSGEGAVITRVTVRRRLLNAGGVTDCGWARSGCVITARHLGDPAAPVATAPIRVDRRAPIVRPILTVDQTTQLRDRQLLTITGEGYDPFASVALVQCLPDDRCAEYVQWTWADDSGRLNPTELPALRGIGGEDCVVKGICLLYAMVRDTHDHATGAALTYDPELPAAPPASVVAAPVEDLSDGQVVDIVGEGFIPGLWLELRQCLAGPEGPGSCRGYGGAPVDPDGTVAFPTEVHRRVGLTDCVEAGCVLRISSGLEDFDIPLAFDASVPPPPLPELTVAPDVDLVDHQAVTLSATGLRVGDWISWRQCVVDEFGPCRWSGGRLVEAEDGEWTVHVVRDLDGQDCAVVACELVVDVSQGGNPLAFSLPLGFDADAPRADPPTAAALPATGLWDGQRVVVRLDGLLPGSDLVVVQCSPGGLPATGGCGAETWEFTDSTRLDMGHEVLALLTTPAWDPGGEVTDCRVVTCEILVSQGDGTPIARLPLQFSGAPPDGGGYPDQLECVAWPTSGWPTGPVPAGVDADELQTAIDEMLASDTAAVVVIHGGRLVGEGYDPGVTPADSHRSYSVAKTFAGTVVGQLVDEGRLTLDGPAPVPEWAVEPDDPRHEISIRHLMNMASGLEWDESYAFTVDTDIIQMLLAADSGGFVADKPLEAEPGAVWEYSTGTTVLLGRILSEELGLTEEELGLELGRRLFDPLGQEVELQYTGSGAWLPTWVSMSTRDFAKLGLLHARGGEWDGGPLVSQDWMEFMHEPSPASVGYGGQIWRRGGFVEMVGLYGQKVTVRPDLDLVVASNTPAGGGGAGTNGIVELFESAAPPSCSNAPILVDDVHDGPAGDPQRIDVLANDPGAGATLRVDTLTVSVPPTNGVAVIDAGEIVYVPEPGFVGDDEFSYLVCTDAGWCGEAVVRVAVVPWGIDLAPEAREVVPTDSLIIDLDVEHPPAAPDYTPRSATSVEIDCDEGAVLGDPQDAGVSVERERLHWETSGSWFGQECRRLTLAFGDGSTRDLLVRLLEPDGWTPGG